VSCPKINQRRKDRGAIEHDGCSALDFMLCNYEQERKSSNEHTLVMGKVAQRTQLDKSQQGSLEALVVSAALTLHHQGRDQIQVKEIAAEVNLLHELRSETVKSSPEKVGHKLKQVGLAIRRLSQAGYGLVMNRATLVLLHQLAATYRGED